MQEFVETLLMQGNDWLIGIIALALFLCGLGAPMSADLMLLTCSYLVYKGQLDGFTTSVVAIFSILASDIIMFFIGKYAGNRIVQMDRFKKYIKPRQFEKNQAHFARFGYFLIFAARFMPGVRTLVFFTGGFLKLRFLPFLIADFLGAVIVIPSLLYSVTFVAGNMDSVKLVLKQSQLSILGITILIAVAIFLLRRSRWRKRT